jgi:cell division control protein 24
LDKLSLVDGMSMYLDSCVASNTTDPLSKLTLICRQGFPLCTLYNALKPAKLLSVDTDPNLNAVNSCKANVYHFIVACRQNLLFPEEDMFTITDLYQDDTNGFVKVNKKNYLFIFIN